MTAADVLEHFLSRADWVDSSKTVDRVIAGDPQTEVSGCMVAWMPGLAALRAAAEAGVELLVCHEPTFWDHRDRLPGREPGCADKLRFIEERGLVVIRIHDCWDRWPQVGIPWAWARLLGFDGEPAAVDARGYQHRYDIAPVAFEQFAERVAARTAAVGEPFVEAAGDPGATVSRIGIGTGCLCDVPVYLEMGCDCFVVCDDGTRYWQDIQYAVDLGLAVICVNHATAEEPGMATLAQYIDEHIDGVAARHLPQGCRFRSVGRIDGAG